MPDPEIHPRALPNDLAPAELLIRPSADGRASLDPARAGWRHLSFAVEPVPADGLAIGGVAGVETCIVVLSGHGATIVADGARWTLPGRENVFADLPSSLWLPDGRALRISIERPPAAGPALVAVARAPRSGRDGGGWGPIVTSTLIGQGTTPRYAIGSVNLAEFFVTLTISATFVATIGLELWPIISGLIIGGVIAAPFAAYATKMLPDKVLMILVGCVVVILSLRTIVATLT